MAFIPFTKTILKSLAKKPPTRPYPREPMPKEPLVRGHVGIDIPACIFCGICARKCPTSAITVDRAKKEWEIDRFKCIVCSACAESCPKKCLFMRPELSPAAFERGSEKVSGS